MKRGGVTYHVNGPTRTGAQGMGMEIKFMGHLRYTTFQGMLLRHLIPPIQ